MTTSFAEAIPYGKHVLMDPSLTEFIIHQSHSFLNPFLFETIQIFISLDSTTFVREGSIIFLLVHWYERKALMVNGIQKHWNQQTL